MKNYIKKNAFLSAIVILFFGIISCEKDFTNIGTSIVKNNIFNTKDTILEIEITNKAITSVKADGLGLGGTLGQYLLGVYNNPNYEKIEASFISQLVVPSKKDLKYVKKKYDNATTIVTSIDTVFIKLPYYATLKKKTSLGPNYILDSIIGNKNTPFNINVYRSSTYLNILNPTNPSQFNSYNSDTNYALHLPKLNEGSGFQFKPNKNDTVVYVSRRKNDGTIYEKESVKYFISKNSKIPLPIAVIPLKKDLIKTLLLDKYSSKEFKTQSNFNNYFRGLIIKASGVQGSLISFNLNKKEISISPSLEVFYTSSVIKSGAVIETIKRHTSFLFSGIRNSVYKMTNRVYPINNQIKLQGTAGSEAEIKILGTPNQLNELRAKKWLINDASLILNIDQSVSGTDTIITPYRLFLYKKGITNNGNNFSSQIKDLFSEGPDTFGGKLKILNNKPEKYIFRITNYISDLLNGKSNYNPTLGLKVFNSIDLPNQKIKDTIIKNYNWNPKVVTLLNHATINGTKRAYLKISYTEKKQK